MTMTRHGKEPESSVDNKSISREGTQTGASRLGAKPAQKSVSVEKNTSISKDFFLLILLRICTKSKIDLYPQEQH